MSGIVKSKTAIHFSESRLLRTLILFLLFLVPTSFMPEENVGFWFPLNLSIALLLTAINYVLWAKLKEDSVRYFSLHSLVMLSGMAFFSMTPVLKELSSSIFFWILLITIILLCFMLFFNFETIGAAFLNPQQKLFKMIVIFYGAVFFFIGILLWFASLIIELPSWMGVANVIFFCGLFFLMVSPAMLITPERAKYLAGRKD